MFAHSFLNIICCSCCEWMSVYSNLPVQYFVYCLRLVKFPHLCKTLLITLFLWCQLYISSLTINYGICIHHCVPFTIVTSYLEEYNIVSKAPMKLVMFKFAIEHMSRVSRVLLQDNGHALLVGEFSPFSILYPQLCQISGCSFLILLPAS